LAFLLHPLAKHEWRWAALAYNLGQWVALDTGLATGGMIHCSAFSDQEAGYHGASEIYSRA